VIDTDMIELAVRTARTAEPNAGQRADGEAESHRMVCTMTAAPNRDNLADGRAWRSLGEAGANHFGF